MLAPIAVQLPEHHHLLALGQLAIPPRLVEEDQPQPTGLVADSHIDHRAASRKLLREHAVHSGHHHGLNTVFEIADSRLVGPVDVAAGIVGQQIQHRLHFNRSQCPAFGPAHSAQHFHIHAVEVDHGERRPVGAGHSKPKKRDTGSRLRAIHSTPK